VTYERTAIRIENVNPLAVGGSRKIHVANDIARQADCLDLRDPHVNVRNDRLNKVRIHSNYFVQLRKGGEVDVVVARLAMPT
jgi:hypothetical protein